MRNAQKTNPNIEDAPHHRFHFKQSLAKELVSMLRGGLEDAATNNSYNACESGGE